MCGREEDVVTVVKKEEVKKVTPKVKEVEPERVPEFVFTKLREKERV